MFSAFIKGFGLGASLIAAIGSQNAFVLSCALRKQHALAIASVCIMIDALLIFSGVWGLGVLIEQYPSITTLALLGGALFLFVYGTFAFYRAYRPQKMVLEGVKTMTLSLALATTLALSLLNPHVYLDTVILLGSIGAQLPGEQSWWFAIGASVASCVWFTSLVVAGRLLAPWFQTVRSWQILDLLVGVTMWSIAIALLLSARG